MRDQKQGCHTGPHVCRTCVVRSIHRTYHTWGEKKLNFFFYPFSSLFPPCPWKRSPQSKTNFFSTKNNVTCWTRTRSWEVRSRRRLALRRVTRKLACFPDWDTFLGRSTAGSTWGLRTVRNRCISVNHIHSTLNTLHRSWRSSRRGTHMSSRKAERWSRDPWRVGNLAIPSSWKILAKGLVRLMMDHSRLPEPIGRYVCM